MLYFFVGLYLRVSLWQAAVVAKVLHHTFLGRVRINYGDPSGEPGADDYHYIWYSNANGNCIGALSVNAGSLKPAGC